jgi:O-succinylbenzoic acid--CoA ligase
MTEQLRLVPTDDPLWLRAALEDALNGGCPVLPLPAEQLDEPETALLREQRLPENTSLVVRTSGSTGIPKVIALSAQALRSSAEATHEAFGGPGQWLVALPLHLISGIQMLIRGIIAGTTPVLLPAGTFDPETFTQHIDRMHNGRRYVSLVPVQLARLLDYAEVNDEAAERLRSFDAILVGGSALSLSLRQRAHELGLELRRSYGSSETAGGCVYDGVEIGDTRVRIREGEVQIAGSCLALGYVHDPDLTLEQFITETEDDGSTTRWYRTGDTGSLLGGMLTVTGRVDRVIISGGVNVSLDEIERVVREQTGWQQAVAASAPDPQWGERPVLIRQRPRPSAANGEDGEDKAGGATFSEVAALVKQQLGAAAVPDREVLVDSIPHLAGGKTDHRALYRLIKSL